MNEKFIVQNVHRNNIIRQIHMTHDVYRDETSQPMEILINTRSDMFREGDEWMVSLTLVKRKDPPAR